MVCTRGSICMATGAEMTKSKFNEPLKPGDRDDQTVGCRHSNPDICGKNALHAVCAFVRGDGMCLAPPLSWARQYKKLQQSQGGEG